MRFQCNNCQLIVAIDDSEMGQPVGCGHCGNVAIVPKTPFSPSAVIGDFVIRKVLGKGGMGTVYLAHQVSLDRPVALKILMEQFSQNSEFIVDFVKEARAAARLNHPNIVQSYAVGEEGGVYHFAMEYVEGQTLKQLMGETGVVPAERALSITQQIAEALDFAWKNQQLVHRDIKPDNIMLTTQGVAKLADLGLARVATELLEDETDEVMGTPQYICPEQLLGQPMDVRGDIYSLGATLYHAITGRFPFQGTTAAEIARKHLQAPLDDPSIVNPDVSPRVAWIIKRMMARKAEDRYQEASELAGDLGRVLRGESPVGYRNTSGAATNAESKTSGRFKSVKGARATGRVRPVKNARGSRRASNAAAGRAPTVAAPAQEAAMPAPTPPAPEPMQPEPAEALTKKKSRTMRLKTKSRTKMRTSSSSAMGMSTTGAPVGGTQSGMPAAPQQGGGKVLVAVLVVVMLLLGAGVAGMVVFYNKYTPDTPSAAEEMYLAQETRAAGEADTYRQIKPYITDRVTETDPETLNAVAAQCYGFLEKYPDSLFSKRAEELVYAPLFNAPAFFEQHLAEVAAPLAGTVARTREQYDELYIRHQRELRREEEEKRIEAYRYQQRLARMRSAVEAMVQERQGELEAIFDGFRERLAVKRGRVEQERAEVFDQLLDLCHERDFDKAIREVRSIQEDRRSYGDALERDIERLIAQPERKRAEVALYQVAKDYAIDFPLVEEKFLQELSARDLEQRKLGVRPLVTEEREIFETRATWFEELVAAVTRAREYYELVSNTQTKLEGQLVTIEQLRHRTNVTRLEVGLVSRHKILIRVKYWNTKSNSYVVDETVRIPLADFPISQFDRLARVSWGSRDPARLETLQAAYKFFTMTSGAQALLEKVAGPEADFMNREFDRIRALAADKRIKWAFLKVRDKAAEEDGREAARRMYELLRQKFGSLPAFQKWDEQFRGALEGVVNQPE